MNRPGLQPSPARHGSGRIRWRGAGRYTHEVYAIFAASEQHLDKFAFYELDADYDLAGEFIRKWGLKGAGAGILAVAVGVARRERVVVHFVSADAHQIAAARELARREKLRVLALPAGLK
jgi:hypothetical protein